MSSKQVNCKNCEQSFDEHFQFCPHCGQKANDELTLGVLFYNTISNYFSFDARFLKSFMPLLFKPGYLAKAFINGKRLLYLHPAQMYLFISIVFFFVFSFTITQHKDTLNREFQKSLDNDFTVIDSVEIRRKDSLERIATRNTLEKNKFVIRLKQKEIVSVVSEDELPERNVVSFGGFEHELDSLIKVKASDEEMYKVMGLSDDAGWVSRKLYEQGLKFYKSRDAGNIMSAFYDKLPIALFFLLPIFAFIIKILYFNKGPYAHHLVFSFYYFSFVFTVLTIIFGINLIYDLPNWIDFIIPLSCFVYFYLALKRFYGQRWMMSLLKASVVSFVFFPVVIFSAIAIGFIAFMFY